MRSEHRAPFVASIVVVLACIGVMAHAVRTDALGGIARRTPMGYIAGAVLQPKPEVAEAPLPEAAAPPVLQGSAATTTPADDSADRQRPAKHGEDDAQADGQDNGHGNGHGDAQAGGSAHPSVRPVAETTTAPEPAEPQ